jgi:hypothetical protein
LDLKSHNIRELYNPSGSTWVNKDLTVLSHGTPAVTGSALGGYVTLNGSQHVNFIDAQGHIHELYNPSGSTWVDNDLTVLAHGTPAVAGSALDGYVTLLDRIQHVNFIDAHGHVHELSNPSGSTWVDKDLTIAPGIYSQVSWNVENKITNCGQHSVVVSNNSPGGEVELWFS